MSGSTPSPPKRSSSTAPPLTTTSATSELPMRCQRTSALSAAARGHTPPPRASGTHGPLPTRKARSSQTPGLSGVRNSSVSSASGAGGTTVVPTVGNGRRPSPVLTPCGWPLNTCTPRFARGRNVSGFRSSTNAQTLVRSRRRSSAFVPPVSVKPSSVQPPFSVRASKPFGAFTWNLHHSRCRIVATSSENALPSASVKSAASRVMGVPFGICP